MTEACLICTEGGAVVGHVRVGQVRVKAPFVRDPADCLASFCKSVVSASLLTQYNGFQHVFTNTESICLIHYCCSVVGVTWWLQKTCLYSPPGQGAAGISAYH